MGKGLNEQERVQSKTGSKGLRCCSEQEVGLV